MESQVNRLAEMGLGKLVSYPNLDQESHAMRITSIIILIVLHTTYNISRIAHIVLHIAHNIIHIAHIVWHIAHNIFHINHSYAIRPSNYGLDIKTSQNEGSTYGTSTREPSLASTESASFIHTYFTVFRSQASVNTSYTQDVV